MMKSLIKRFWFLLIPVCAVVVFFVVLPVLQFLLEDPRQRRIRQEWEELVFSPIEHDVAFEEKIHRAITKNAKFREIDGIQQTALGRAILSFLYAHSDGSWESFRDFRLPLGGENAVFRESALNQFASELPPSREAFLAALKQYNESKWGKKYGQHADTFFDLSSPDAIFETYWRHVVANTVSVDGNPTFCTRCWKSLAVDSFQFSVQLVSSKPAATRFELETNAIGMSLRLPASLSNKPSIEELLTRSKRVQIAYVSVIVKADHHSSPYPVHVGFYWSQDHRNWLPMGMSVSSIDLRSESIEYFF